MADTPHPTSGTLFPRLLAAAPLAAAAVLFLSAALSDKYLLWTDAFVLGRIMQIEWLVLACGIFLIVPLVLHTEKLIPQIIRITCVVGLGWVFVRGAYSMDGWRGVFAFCVLLLFSYGAKVLLVRDTRIARRQIPLVVARWVICLFTFFPLVVLFDLPVSVESWDGRRESVQLGAAFFSLLCVLELTLFGWMEGIIQVGFAGRPFGADVDHAGAAERARHYRKLYGVKDKP